MSDHVYNYTLSYYACQYENALKCIISYGIVSYIETWEVWGLGIKADKKPDNKPAFPVKDEAKGQRPAGFPTLRWHTVHLRRHEDVSAQAYARSYDAVSAEGLALPEQIYGVGDGNKKNDPKQVLFKAGFAFMVTVAMISTELMQVL